jgi:acyl-CoA thioesterase YciA
MVGALVDEINDPATGLVARDFLRAELAQKRDVPVRFEPEPRLGRALQPSAAITSSSGVWRKSLDRSRGASTSRQHDDGAPVSGAALRSAMAEEVIDQQVEDRGEPAVRTLAMPADTNPAGDIFGGWVLAQMDLAAGIVAHSRARSRVVTAALDGMAFHRPVYVGDLVSCYAKVTRIGRTSMTVEVETYARRGRTGEEVKVTEGRFTVVAIDEQGRPRPVPGNDAS